MLQCHFLYLEFKTLSGLKGLNFEPKLFTTI